MKKHFMLAMFISCMITIFCLVGCGNNEKQPTTVDLTLKNYKEYFTINEDITEYNREDYTANYGGYLYTKVNQTTKFSIIQLKQVITFNNVVITFVNDTKTGSVIPATGKPIYHWTGNDGKLFLAYDGSGSVTLRATYDSYASQLEQYPMKYKIEKIEGSITIK